MNKHILKGLAGSLMNAIWQFLKVSALFCFMIVAIVFVITCSIAKQIFYSTYPR